MVKDSVAWSADGEGEVVVVGGGGVGRGAATVVIDRTVDKGMRRATVYQVN